MAFGFLEKRLNKTIEKVKKYNTISKENLDEILNDFKVILLDSDVNLKVVRSFLQEVETKATNLIIEDNKTSSQEIIKIINDQLIEILGKKAKDLSFKNDLAIVMVVGLQGSGKTTSIVKIANLIKTKNRKYKKPLLIAGDIYRPAAIDQLKTLGQDIGVEVFEMGTKEKPQLIVEQGIVYAKKNNFDLIIIDTAGRLQIDKNLMNELADIKKIAKPEEIIYVVDAMSGQDIINVVEEFNNQLKLTGLVISKLDSEAKGGAALSLVYLLSLPIYLIGTGEKVTDLEQFHPNRMASRLLGFGDIETLLEKAQEKIDQNANQLMFKRMMQGKLDLDDLRISMREMKKIGKASNISKMIPGLNKISANAKLASLDDKLPVYEIILNSTTLKERRNPLLIKQPKRRDRIITGSGRTIQELNGLLSYYEKTAKQMKNMKKLFANGKMPNLNDIMSGGGLPSF